MHVDRVVDGDTIVAGGLTIRIIGIDAPEMDTCGGPEATALMQDFVNSVPGGVLLSPGARDDQDKYGRYLRYVDAVDGRAGSDLGLALIGSGHAIARYDGRDGYGTHPRQGAYVAADAASPDYTCTAKPAPAPAPTTAPAPAPTTAPSGTYYQNCDAARAAGAAPIQRGEPGYRSPLDRDNDGIACE